jgi:hypothetical protein
MFDVPRVSAFAVYGKEALRAFRYDGRGDRAPMREAAQCFAPSTPSRDLRRLQEADSSGAGAISATGSATRQRLLPSRLCPRAPGTASCSRPRTT